MLRLTGPVIFVLLAALAASAATAQEIRDCVDCPPMVTLPGGTYVRAINSITPQQEVTVGPFALAKYEVTNTEFTQFVAETGRTIEPGCSVLQMMGPEVVATATWQAPGYNQSPTAPAVCVSWDDAVAYAEWLSAKTGQRYRLPTEAEWDYAAHAGAPNDVTYYFYGGLDVMGANCQDCGGADAMGREFMLSARAVGAYPPNPLGIHDILGNAAEWVTDCFNPTYAGAPVDGAAWLTGNCDRRVVRGGHWYSYWPELAGFRQGPALITRSNSIGFRVARDL